MADPHIQSKLDFWDKLTVTIYRLGFIFAAIGLLLLSWSFQGGYSLLLIAGTLCASSLHIYLKHFRLLFQFATWIALLCAYFNLPELALGGVLVTLGGLCFKEYFCFRIPLLNIQPIFVACLWGSVVFEMPFAIRIFSLISGGLLALLAIQKCRMPLHFDIGDKSKYQI